MPKYNTKKKTPHYDPIMIAKYMINANMNVNQLVLQKIMYYLQAAFLVERNKPCFLTPIYAFSTGPYLSEIYKEFVIYGREIIPHQPYPSKVVFDELTFSVKRVPQTLILDGQDADVVEKIINVYGRVQDPFLLARKTMSERPWQQAHNTLEKIIDLDDIEDYYTENKKLLYEL